MLTSHKLKLCDGILLMRIEVLTSEMQHKANLLAFLRFALFALCDRIKVERLDFDRAAHVCTLQL